MFDYQELVNADMSWHARAACRDYDLSAGDPWFSEKGQSSKRARAVCGGCEVRETCLSWALENGIEYGIWGGLSRRERKTLSRLELRDGPELLL